jgi:hypothetical protein
LKTMRNDEQLDSLLALGSLHWPMKYWPMQDMQKRFKMRSCVKNKSKPKMHMML